MIANARTAESSKLDQLVMNDFFRPSIILFPFRFVDTRGRLLDVRPDTWIRENCAWERTMAQNPNLVVILSSRFYFRLKNFFVFRIFCPSFLFPFLSLCHYEHFNFYHERAILFCFSVIGLRSASLWLLLLSAIFYEFLAAVGFPILPRNCLAANELQHKSPCRKYTKLRAQ